METKQNKLHEFLLKNSSFPILLAILCAGVWGGLHMYYVNGTGLFTDVIVGQMFLNAEDTGGFMTLGLFGLGYLFARILEGPLVGILDIGGGVMTGLGVGIPSILMAFGFSAPLENFGLALLFGAVIGYLVGLLIILMKKTMSKGVTASGTNIMMGAGNALGVYLAPLLILASVKYSMGAGIGALVGALVFYLFDKNIVGGVMIGAMIFGLFF